MTPSLWRWSSTGPIGVWLLLISCLFFIRTTRADSSKYVKATTEEGETVYLLDERKPALYTQNFGDCLGDSLINVTRFDAAYYKDNMTVSFHLEGNTAVANESLMRGLMLQIRGFVVTDISQCTSACLPMENLASTSPSIPATPRFTGGDGFVRIGTGAC